MEILLEFLYRLFWLNWFRKEQKESAVLPDNKKKVPMNHVSMSKSAQGQYPDRQ